MKQMFEKLAITRRWFFVAFTFTCSGGQAFAAQPSAEKILNFEMSLIIGFLSLALLLFVLWLLVSRRSFAKKNRDLESRIEQFSAIINNTSSIIFLKDLEGDYLFVNEQFEVSSGKKNDELVGKKDNDIYQVETAEDLKKNDRQVVEANEVLEFEEVVQFKNKTKTYISTKFPLRRASGEIYAVCGIATDITARKKMEKELLESQSMLDDAEKIARLGSWRFDRESQKLVWSDTLYEIYGFDKSEFSGDYSEFLNVIYPEERGYVDTEYKDAINHENPFDIVHRIIRKSDGAIRWVREKSTFSLDENGQFMSAHGTVQDITEQKNLEHQLVRSQKMEAIGQLTGGIAHDFNNLLGIVEGNLELLQRLIPKEQDKVHKRIEPALRATRRGGNLTKRLLSFSRRKPQEALPVSLNDLLVETMALLEKTLTNSVSLDVFMEDNLWLTVIDPGDMEDAIINLAINARDAMSDTGKIIIRTENAIITDADLSHYPEARSGEFVKFSIQDSGEGIAKELQSKIFNPFFSTKENDKGTGLGLSMVYGFISRSRGFIHLDTKIGAGSTFYLFLPRVIEASSGEIKEFTEKNKDQADLVGGDETILVVDDEADLLDVVAGSLQAVGYKIHQANSPKEAMALLERGERIDLIFSDIVMPGEEDGLALAVKVMREYPEVKLLLTSGYSEKVLALRNKDNPVVTYLLDHILPKPVRREVLIPSIRQALDTAIAIKWSDRMTTGIPQIDDDHKILVTLLNQLLGAVQNRQEHQAIIKISDSLLNYVSRHFAREEAVMEVCEYPHLENHRNIHRLLTQKAESFAAFLAKGDDHKVVVDFVEFIKGWFLDHTLSMDRTIYDYTLGKEEVIEATLKEIDH